MIWMHSWHRANPTAATSQDSGKAVHFDTVWQILKTAEAFGKPKTKQMPLVWEANSSFWLRRLKTSELAYQNPLFSLFDAPEGVEGLLPFMPQQFRSNSSDVWTRRSGRIVDSMNAGSSGQDPSLIKNTLTNILQIGWNHQLYSFVCENQSKIFFTGGFFINNSRSDYSFMVEWKGSIPQTYSATGPSCRSHSSEKSFLLTSDSLFETSWGKKNVTSIFSWRSHCFWCAVQSFFEQRLDPCPVADYGVMSDDMSKSYPKTDPKIVQHQTHRFLSHNKHVFFF